MAKDDSVPYRLRPALPAAASPWTSANTLALQGVVAISNGSACTSQNYSPSHMLTAMGLPEDHVKGALRLSWCHLTPEVHWEQVVNAIRKLQ